MATEKARGRPWLGALAALALAVASACLAYGASPRGFVGRYNDDALYAASALSLAQGHGYSYLFGPVPIAASRYPPLFPAALAPVGWFSGAPAASRAAETGQPGEGPIAGR